MNLTNTLQNKQAANNPALDGYIRLSVTELMQITFEHLDSGLYHDLSETEQVSNRCALRGYTEWVGLAKPMISVGWDWEWVSSTNGNHYKVVGLPFSNVLLQDSKGKDCLLKESEIKLLEFISGLDWAPKLESFTTHKYA